MLDSNNISPMETNANVSPESTPTNAKGNKGLLQKLLLPTKKDSTISNAQSPENNSPKENGNSSQPSLIKLTALSLVADVIKKPDILSRSKVQAFESRILGVGVSEEAAKAKEYCKEYPMHADLVKSILTSKVRTDDDVMTLYEKLRELPFFARLEKEFTILTDNEAFLFLLRNLSWAEYPKGKFIGKENEPFDNRVFVINKGRVCILASSAAKYEYQQLKDIDYTKAEQCMDDSFNEIDDPEVQEEGKRERDRKENFLSPRIVEELEENKKSKPNSKENSFAESPRKKGRSRGLTRENSQSPKKFTKDMIVDMFVKRKTTTVYAIKQQMQRETESNSNSPIRRMMSKESNESPKRRLGGSNPQNSSPNIPISKFSEKPGGGEESPEKPQEVASPTFSFNPSPSPDKKGGVGGMKLWKKLQANLMRAEDSPVSSPEDANENGVFTYPDSPISKFKWTLRKYVIQKYGAIVDHLSDGESFCEKALFTKQRKAFSMVAMTNVELITLADDKFIEAKKKLERKKKEAIDFVVGILPGLHKSPLFDPYASIGLYSIMGQQTYLKGHNIITEGKVDNKFYILFEGECEVQRTLVTQAYDPYNKLEEIKTNLIVPFTSRETFKINIIRIGAIFGEEVLFGDKVKYTNTIKVSSLYAKVLVFERERMVSRLTSDTLEEFRKFYLTKQDNYFQSIRSAVQLKGYDVDPKSFYEDTMVSTKLREEKILQSNFHSPSKVPFLIAHGVFKGEEEQGSILNQSQIEQNLNNSGGVGGFQSVRDSGNAENNNSLIMPNCVVSNAEYNSAPKPTTVKILNSRVVSASVTRPMSSAAISISERRPMTRPTTGGIVSFDARTPTPINIGELNANTASTSPFRNTISNFNPSGAKGDDYQLAGKATERANSAGGNFFTSIRALKMSNNAIFKSQEDKTPFGNQFRVMMSNEKERVSAIRGDRAPSAQRKTGQPKIRSSENTKVNFYDQDNIKFRLNLLKEKTKQHSNIQSPLDIKFRFGDSKNKYEEKREAIVYGQFEKPGKETPNLHTLDRIMQKHIVNTYRNMGEADSGLLEVKDDIFTKYPRTDRSSSQPYYSTIAVGKSKKSKKFVPSDVINIHTIHMREQVKNRKRDMSRRSMRNADTQTLLNQSPAPDIELGTKTVVFARRESQPMTRISRVTVSGNSGAATHGESQHTLTHFRANSDFTNTLKTRLADEI